MIPGLWGRVLGEDELRSVALAVAGRPEVWEGRVARHPVERTFARVHSDAHLTVWVIRWLAGHDTGFHDHDRSAGAVTVLEGAVREERMAPHGAPRVSTFGAGGTFSFAAGEIHRVLHAGDVPAMTVHAYSPALRTMGAYLVSPAGTLVRQAMTEDEELRAAAVAA